MRLALIPARGGSKRLHRKNIAPFAGRPMFAWTVDAAKESGVFDSIVLSTDDEEIATIGASCGASVLRRPIDVSNDQATLVDVIRHAVRNIHEVSEICLLLPNCPLRPASEIIRSEQQWRESSVGAQLSVVDYAWTPPFRAQRFLNENRLAPLDPEMVNKKSQLYPEVVCPSGAIYWCKTSIIKNASSLYVQDIRGFRMPWHLAIDIDTPEDMRLAECVRFSIDHGFRF